MEASGASLRLQRVTVEYPSGKALDNVTLTLEPGQAVALVGLSGAGKTTLLNVCNGMVRPGAGTVEVDGRDLARMPAAELKQVRIGIGFVHQDLSLIPNLRVVQNVLCGRLGRRSLAGGARDLLFPSRGAVRRVYEILESVGIPEKLFERTDRLSGGQQQRVAIARALFQDPRILLADEPVSSLDPARAQSTIALVRKICAERGLTLCVSLHNLDLARRLFPRLVALRSGHVVFDKPTDAVGQAELDGLYRLAEEPSSPPRAAHGAAVLLEDGLGGRFG